jgi:hypothetical protein
MWSIPITEVNTVFRTNSQADRQRDHSPFGAQIEPSQSVSPFDDTDLSRPMSDPVHQVLTPDLETPSPSADTMAGRCRHSDPCAHKC